MLPKQYARPALDKQRLGELIDLIGTIGLGDKLADDVRWKYGAPPKGNANFAWVQHFVHHLSPKLLSGDILARGAEKKAVYHA